MSAKYTYSITDFPNDKVNIGTLGIEIDDSAIEKTLEYLKGSPTACDIYFNSTLTSGEVNTLDGLVTTHSGIDSPYEYNVGGGTVVEAPISDKHLLIYDGQDAQWYFKQLSLEDDIITISGTGVRDISFLFGTYDLPYLVCSDTDWITRRAFIFQGTNKLGIPQEVQLLAYTETPSNPGHCRIYDATNLNEIAYIGGIADTSASVYIDDNLQSLPSDTSIFEIQLKTDKKGELHVHSLILEF